MSPFEKVFLEFGMSWQWSKVLPYLCILITIFSAIFLLKRKRKLNKLRSVLLMVLFFMFSVVHFACYPIYDIDFVDTGNVTSPPPNFSQITAQEVYVLVIPGCPLCKQSFEISQLLKERSPKLNITYVVVDNDPRNLNDFKKMAKGKFKVVLVANIGEATKLVNNGFPAFIVRHENGLKMWNFSQMGAISLDELEKIVRR